ncbi:MAG: hypothetical protein ABFE13_22240 [Phycisphaerales bacterium]
MGFDITIITECLKLSKKQIREVLFTIILPVAGGVALIAAFWPSLIRDGRTLNICLLGFVVALPMVLINNLVWSLLLVAFMERVTKVVTTSYLLSSPILKTNELLRNEMRGFWEEWFDQAGYFDDMRSEALGSFRFRDIASVLTAIEFYMTAIMICLFGPGALISVLLFLVIALLPPICAMVIIKKVSSELQSTLSNMTHHEIMDRVSQFVVHHFSADVVKQMQSFLYAYLDGDPRTPLSTILDERMIAADRVLLERENEIQEALGDGSVPGTPS